MEILIAFLILIALFGLLDLAALRWGRDSRSYHVSESQLDHRSNW
jgi:hypothetical protein